MGAAPNCTALKPGSCAMPGWNWAQQGRGICKFPVHRAVAEGDVSEALRMLDGGWTNARGQGINSLDQDGVTPLLLAIRQGDAAACKKLLDAGADVEQPDGAGHQPLRVAVE